MPIRNHFAALSPGALGELAMSAVVQERQGPVLQAELHLPQPLANLLTGSTPPQPVSGLALIDCGASMTVVAEQALQQLNVQPIGTTTVRTPSGQETQLLYPAELEFVGMPGRMSFASVCGSAHLHKQGLLVLVGRDILRHSVFVYNGSTGSFILAL